MAFLTGFCITNSANLFEKSRPLPNCLCVAKFRGRPILRGRTGLLFNKSISLLELYSQLFISQPMVSHVSLVIQSEQCKYQKIVFFAYALKRVPLYYIILVVAFSNVFWHC